MIDAHFTSDKRRKKTLFTKSAFDRIRNKKNEEFQRIKNQKILEEIQREMNGGRNQRLVFRIFQFQITKKSKDKISTL